VLVWLWNASQKEASGDLPPTLPDLPHPPPVEMEWVYSARVDKSGSK